MILIFDIETDGLLEDTTTIHSLVIKDYETKKVYSCTNHSSFYTPITEGLQMLSEADLVIGHNIICFDLPAIKKLYPFFKLKGKVSTFAVLKSVAYAAILIVLLLPASRALFLK